MESPKIWFRAWIKEHKALNPHKEWTRYETPGFKFIYRPWVRAFRQNRITLEIATAASERMAAEEGIYPEKHLPRILKLGRQIRDQLLMDEQARTSQARTKQQEHEQKMEARAKLLWSQIADEIREPYRQAVAKEFPALRQVPKFIETLARGRWLEEAEAQANTLVRS